jgi:hypothetical protein
MKKALILAACLAVVAGMAPRASAQLPPAGPVIPGQNVGPFAPPANPWEGDKDRDQRLGVGGIPHIPHVPLHLPSPAAEFKAPPVTTLFKAPPVRELPSVGGWAGKTGGGLLAGIGAAIAGFFRALFGRKKDDGTD